MQRPRRDVDKDRPLVQVAEIILPCQGSKAGDIVAHGAADVAFDFRSAPIHVLGQSGGSYQSSPTCEEGTTVKGFSCRIVHVASSLGGYMSDHQVYGAKASVAIQTTVNWLADGHVGLIGHATFDSQRYNNRFKSCQYEPSCLPCPVLRCRHWRLHNDTDRHGATVGSGWQTPAQSLPHFKL